MAEPIHRLLAAIHGEDVQRLARLSYRQAQGELIRRYLPVGLKTIELQLSGPRRKGWMVLTRGDAEQIVGVAIWKMVNRAPSLTRLVLQAGSDLPVRCALEAEIGRECRVRIIGLKGANPSMKELLSKCPLAEWKPARRFSFSLKPAVVPTCKNICVILLTEQRLVEDPDANPRKHGLQSLARQLGIPGGSIHSVAEQCRDRWKIFVNDLPRDEADESQGDESRTQEEESVSRVAEWLAKQPLQMPLQERLLAWQDDLVERWMNIRQNSFHLVIAAGAATAVVIALVISVSFFGTGRAAYEFAMVKPDGSGGASRGPVDSTRQSRIQNLEPDRLEVRLDRDHQWVEIRLRDDRFRRIPILAAAADRTAGTAVYSGTSEITAVGQSVKVTVELRVSPEGMAPTLGVIDLRLDTGSESVEFRRVLELNRPQQQ